MTPARASSVACWGLLLLAAGACATPAADRRPSAARPLGGGAGSMTPAGAAAPVAGDRGRSASSADARRTPTSARLATTAAPRPVPSLTASAGRSVEGREIPYTVVGRGERCVLVLATIHGDEGAGTPLVEELVRRVTADGSLLAGRRLVAVPVANPDGLARGSRGNSRGVDLNRNFPSRNHQPAERHGEEPLSEPESSALATLLAAHEPELVVSIHQPLACVDYDGPAGVLATAMSLASGLPVRRLGSRPGSLGSHVGADGGIPIVTLELPRSADHLAPGRSWELYGPALLKALSWTGAVAAGRSGGAGARGAGVP